MRMEVPYPVLGLGDIDSCFQVREFTDLLSPLKLVKKKKN